MPHDRFVGRLVARPMAIDQCGGMVVECHLQVSNFTSRDRLRIQLELGLG